ncbi:hypothetical protein [Pasteurella bettyae]
MLNEGYTHYGKLWGIPIYADDVSPLDVVEVVGMVELPIVDMGKEQ